jgi:glycosyltransferase involved in cell wall biosynthesis
VRIVAFSVNPLYSDKVLGGAPRQLRRVTEFLAAQGHEVEVLCTAPPDAGSPFDWDDGVRVNPCLPLKQPFPQPYAVPAYRTATTIDRVARALANADRFYLHDGEFLFPYVYAHVPTVVSLRDNVYPETLLGGFISQGDSLIAISQYSADLYRHTMGRFLDGFADRIVVVANGIDERFQPEDPAALAEELGVDPKRDYLLLHPHRPDPAKGLEQTIELAHLLVRRYDIQRLKVLVPEWIESAVSVAETDHRIAMRKRIAELGLSEKFVFHRWINVSEMPAYYSLGHMSLALGCYPESFGNVAYESIACATPAVVANVGPHRDQLQANWAIKVEFDAIEDAAERVASALANGERPSDRIRALLRQRFSVDAQVRGYAETILGVVKQPPMPLRTPPPMARTRWRLAPWCYVVRERIYHDFRYEYVRDAGLLWLAETTEPRTLTECQTRGIGFKQLHAWEREGFVVPCESTAA